MNLLALAKQIALPPPMMRAMNAEERMRARVLRAISLNRTPGYHFPGNFIDLSFDRVASADTRVSYENDAEADIGSLSVLADFALGTSIRPATTVHRTRPCVSRGRGRGDVTNR